MFTEQDLDRIDAQTPHKTITALTEEVRRLRAWLEVAAHNMTYPEIAVILEKALKMDVHPDSYKL